ncbi:WxL domain-containing protein [Levilactobacillus brevis]|nr:WxL domain-containing protein [Levilactobacillus brevis]
MKRVLWFMASLTLGIMFTAQSTALANSGSLSTTAKVTLSGDGSTKPVNPGEPTDPDDSGNDGTGSKGKLTLDYVPNLTFKQQQVTKFSKISAAALQLGSASFAKASTTNVSASPTVTDSATSLIPIGSYSLVASANKGTGLGTWLLQVNRSATAPTKLLVDNAVVKQQQTYQGALTWLLTDTNIGK